MALDKWYVAIDLMNTFFFFFLMPISKGDQKQLAFIWNRQQYIFTFLSQGEREFSASNMVQNVLHHLDIG